MSNESGQGGGAPTRQPTAEGSGIDDAAIVEDPTVRDHPRYQQMFPVLTGAEVDRMRLALQNFLRRNAFPNMTLDAEEDPEAVALLERLTPQPDDFPFVGCPNGTVLRNPDEGQLASCLGLIPEFATM